MQLCCHRTFDTTEIDRLITKIAHINTSLDVHSLHQDTRKRLYVKQCKACKLNIVYVANLEVNWYCENDLLNSVAHAHTMPRYSLEQFSFNLVS